ncbi:MAG: ABC transporter transmembrane domain-containing protein, partial [Candidatus Binataceae bacterium]
MNDVSSRKQALESTAPMNSVPPQTAPVRRVRVRPLLALVPYVMRYRGQVGAALVALLVAAMATLIVPLAVRRMIDFGFSAERIGLIDQYFAVMILVAGVLAVASASRYYLVTIIGERVVADLRSSVFAHLTDLSPAFFDTAQTGEITSRLTADTTQIKSAVGSSVSVALRNIVLFVGSSVMMVVTSPRLSFFVIAAIPVIVLPLVAFGRLVRRRSRTAQDTLADASAYAAELFGAIRTLQAFTNERLAATRFSGVVERAFDAARQSTRARAILTAIIIFLVFGSVVVILWVGAQDVLAGRTTPGTLGQFILYAVFAASGLGQLSEVWGELSQASGAAERLTELLAVEPDIKAPAHPVALPNPARGEVAFDAVRFAYPSRPEAFVLDGVSFGVRQGEKIAIVGPSGAGKSTIFHLLLRFYDAQSGGVTFDGVRVGEADPAELRRRIALVPQDVAVFAASVAENIRFGRPDASDADIVHAAELAGAAEYINRLPQRYDTPIGERGVTLSGGQRQRIAIARAILRDAPLLLLDE